MKNRYRVWNWGKNPKNGLRIYKSFRTFRKARKYLQHMSQFDKQVILYDCKTCKKYTVKDLKKKKTFIDWIMSMLGNYDKVYDNNSNEVNLDNKKGNSK